jgi:hypothetical protein
MRRMSINWQVGPPSLALPANTTALLAPIGRCVYPLPWYSGGGLGWGSSYGTRSVPTVRDQTPSPALPRSTRGGRNTTATLVELAL